MRTPGESGGKKSAIGSFGKASIKAGVQPIKKASNVDTLLKKAYPVANRFNQGLQGMNKGMSDSANILANKVKAAIAQVKAGKEAVIPKYAPTGVKEVDALQKQLLDLVNHPVKSIINNMKGK